MMRKTLLSLIFTLPLFSSINASQALSKTKEQLTLGNVCKLANESYQQQLSSFLAKASPDEALRRLDHESLLSFFLSYVDIPPRDRCFIRRGPCIESNITQNGEAQDTWARYAQAWTLASAAHDQEAQNFLKQAELNRQLLVPIPLEEPLVTQLLEKSCHARRFKEAQSLVQQEIQACLEKYCDSYVEIGKIKGIKEALKRFIHYAHQCGDQSFLTKKGSDQIALYLAFKDAGKLLLEKCTKEKGMLVDRAKELLAHHDTIINGLNAECLPPYHAACSLLRNKDTEAHSLCGAVEDFFRYCPGIATVDHLRFAYNKLFNAALSSDNPSLQAELYQLCNTCARKLYYVLGDAATSDELFEAFLRFRHAAFCFENGSTKVRESLSTAARYYYMRGEHALAFETARVEKSPGALSEAASKLEEKGDNPTLKVPALKDLYYKTALDLSLKRVGALDVTLHSDFVYIAHLHYKRGQNEKGLDKKRAYYQEALKWLIEPLEGIDKEEPYDQPSSNDLKRQEKAVMYRRAAALYYSLVLTSCTATGIEGPKPKLTAFIFDKHDGNLPYESSRQAVYSEDCPYLFDEKTQTQYLKEAARCAIALVSKLQGTTTFDYLSFACDMLEYVTDVIDKDDPFFERCLTLQKEYLDRRIALLGDFSELAESKESARRLRNIGKKTGNQLLKGEAYEQALVHLRQARTENKLLTCEELTSYIQELVVWSEDHRAQLPIPSRFKLPLWEHTSHMIKFLLSLFQDKLPQETLKNLFTTLSKSAEDKALTSQSFRATYLLTSYCYKAAWLSMDPQLICAHLLQAARHLEELLTLLPEDTWPAYEHYYLLGLTYEKAATLSASNPSAQRELEKRAHTYQDLGKQVNLAEDHLKVVGFELHLFGNPLQPNIRPKGLGIKSDYDSFLGFLRDCIDRIEALEIVLDDTGYTIEQEDSDEIPDECVDEIHAALCSQVDTDTPQVHALALALALQSQENKETVIHQAHSLLNNPKGQEELFIRFLRYVSAVPLSKRLYIRKGACLGRNYCVEDEKAARTLWEDYLRKLITLVILEHPRACSLLVGTLKESVDDSLCLESFFSKELEIPFKHSEEIRDQLKLGQVSVALTLLKEYALAPQQKKQLEDILGHTSKKHTEEDDAAAERKLKTAVAQRQGLKSLAQLTAETAQQMNGLEKAQLLVNAGLYLVQQIAHTAPADFPDPAEIEQAYKTLVTARDCPGITDALALTATKEAVQLCLQLIDYLGDTATPEQLKCAYDEGINEIKAREKQLSALIGAKYDEERSKESILMQNLFTRLREHFNTYFGRLHPHPRPQDILKQACDFRNMADESSLEEGTPKGSDDFQLLRRSFSGRAVSPLQKAPTQGALIRCFLLAQSVEYYRSWINLLGSHAAEKQLEEAAKIALIGYQSARDAQAPVLRAQLLETFITLQESRLNLHLSLGQAKAEILDTCSVLLTKIGEQNPSDLFTKMTLHQKRAKTLHDPKARYKALKKACKEAWHLLEACHLLVTPEEPDPGMSVIIKGQEVQRKVSSIRSSIALLALEAAKQATTLEQKIVLIENCLKALAIDLPLSLAAEKASSKTNYFEIIKAFLRKSTQKPQALGMSSSYGTPYASLLNTPAQSQRVTPLPSPFSSQAGTPMQSPGRSTTASPREEEAKALKSPRNPRGTLSRSSDQQPTALRNSLRISTGSDLARKTLIGARTSPRSPQTASPRSPLASPRPSSISPRTIRVSPRPNDIKSNSTDAKRASTGAKLAGELKKLFQEASPAEERGRARSASMSATGGASPLARKTLYSKLGQPPKDEKGKEEDK